MKIFNTEVFGIESALIRAGYPMQEVVNERIDLDATPWDHLIRRGTRLGHTQIGLAHDKYLRTIHCHFDITAPRYFFQELRTYTHITMNSQSTMHRIQNMDIERMVNSNVDQRVLAVFKEYVDAYKANPSEENLLKLKANLPEGFELTSAVDANYASLKTIFAQRRNHRLPEWREFCQWVGELPYAVEFGVVQ